MLMTLIQKEIMHHILSVRFVALLLMCLLLVPLTLSINYRRYSQNLVDYQESVKREQTEAKENPTECTGPEHGGFQVLPQTYTFERLCERFRGCVTNLSWYDA